MIYRHYADSLTKFKELVDREEQAKKDMDFFKANISEIPQTIAALKLAKASNPEGEKAAWIDLILAGIKSKPIIISVRRAHDFDPYFILDH